MPRTARLDACPPMAGTGCITPCDYPGNRAAEGAGEESIMLLGGEGVGDECDRACEEIRTETLYDNLCMPKRTADGDKAKLSACL